MNELALVKNLIGRAFGGIESLPSAEKVALYRGAASVLRGFDAAEAEVAAHAASLIEEAEGCQLKFLEMLQIGEGIA